MTPTPPPHPPTKTQTQTQTNLHFLVVETDMSICQFVGCMQPCLFLHIVELNNVLPLDPATATLDSPV